MPDKQQDKIDIAAHLAKKPVRYLSRLYGAQCWMIKTDCFRSTNHMRAYSDGEKSRLNELYCNKHKKVDGMNCDDPAALCRTICYDPVPVTIGPDNVHFVAKYWGTLYFDNYKEAAETKRGMAVARRSVLTMMGFSLNDKGYEDVKYVRNG